jgi:TPR repeat protein
MQEPSKTLREAMEMLSRGKLSAAAEFLRAAADRGEVDAIHAMGDLYLKGVGVERNVARALEYFNSAAKQGYSQAMIDLSQMYANGDGVASDVPKALELCEAAAAVGDSRGWLILAGIYQHGGFGVPVNMDLAVDYYKKAVAANDAEAACYLSGMYINGTGVPKNLELGFRLCEQSAAGDSEAGLYALAYMCETGYEGHPQNLARANSLYRRAARLGHAGAKSALQRFPPVVELGAISASPGVVNRLAETDIAELIKRHSSGDWGDVDAVEWDRNDAALAKGEYVRSLHQAPQMVVVVSTEGNRRSTFLELLNEDFNQPVDLLESAERALRMFNLMKNLFS